MNPVPDAVAIEGLQFCWPGAAAPCLVLDTFRLAPGERLFLHGPSGSGKSTLLALIGGVLTPQAGQVRLFGQSLADLGARQRDRLRADRIGFVFQLFNLLPWLTAAQNIVLAVRFSRARADRLAASGRTPAAEMLRLAQRLDLPPALLARPAAELSVGQQQRVAAARALIGSPPLVIADEPTSALDADNQAAFLDLLRHECEAAGAALIFVSHDLRLADAFARRLSLPALNRAAGARP